MLTPLLGAERGSVRRPSLPLCSAGGLGCCFGYLPLSWLSFSLSRFRFCRKVPRSLAACRRLLRDSSAHKGLSYLFPTRTRLDRQSDGEGAGLPFARAPGPNASALG